MSTHPITSVHDQHDQPHHTPAPDSEQVGVSQPARSRWVGLTLLSVAQFMLVLDITVVNIALPRIGTELTLDRATLTWVVSAYTLVFGGLLLLGGRAADQFGARRVAMAGLALFTAASLAAGLASGGAMLIGARLAQGAGAALLSPAALSIISTTFHGSERHRALAVWSSLGAVGAAVGVVLGGALTAGPGWQWAFYVNVPVGAAILIALPRVIPATVRRGSGMDLVGAVLATAATASLIYGLINAGDEGWTSRWTILPITAAVVVYAGFAATQRIVRSPLLDLRVLTDRSVVAGGLLILTVTGLMIASLFLGSFYLQQLRGFGPMAAGLLSLPVAVAVMLGAAHAGQLMTHVGTRYATAASLALVGAGMAVAAMWPQTAVVVGGTVVAGIGMGPLFVIGTVVGLSQQPPERAGTTSGLINTFHELGGALGVATISSIAAASLAIGGGTPTLGGFVHGYWFAAGFGLVTAVLAAVAMPDVRPAAGAIAHGH